MMMEMKGKMNEKMEEKMESTPAKKRDDWEIKEDIRATEKFFEIMKDPARLKEMQDMIKSKKSSVEAVDALADGDLQKAIGFIS